MNKTVTVKGKSFKTYISHEEIIDRVKKIAQQVNKDYKSREPIFLAILNGSFFFASDLLKEIELQCEVSFVKLASYMGTKTTGRVKEIIGLTSNINGRDVIILEDIVDTGKTIKSLISQLEEHYPDSIKVATLLFKKEALEEEVIPDYVGFEIENDFVIGYGLDYDQYGRNLKDIYILNS